MRDKEDYYSVPPEHYSIILEECIKDAKERVKEYQIKNSHIIDIKLFIQKWPETCCGFGCGGYKIMTLAPTVVIKYNHCLRFIYHNGFFAYKLVGPTTVMYYDAVRARQLPGPNSSDISFLVEG